MSEFHLDLAQFVEIVNDFIRIDLPFSYLVFSVVIDDDSLGKYHFYITVLMMNYCEFERSWKDFLDNFSHILYLFFSIFVSPGYLNRNYITLSPF